MNLLIDEARKDVLSILFCKSGFVDESHLFAGLYASTMENDEKRNTGKVIRDLGMRARCNRLERIMDDNYGDIVNDISWHKIEIYSWLSQGTYRLL